jgi:hypothetical protein
MKESANTRNTVDVVELVNWANEQLRRTDEYADEKFKAGIFHTVRQVLFKTKNYEGFNYTYWYDRGFDEWKSDGEPIDKDPYMIADGGTEYDRFFYAPTCSR